MDLKRKRTDGDIPTIRVEKIQKTKPPDLEVVEGPETDTRIGTPSTLERRQSSQSTSSGARSVVPKVTHLFINNEYIISKSRVWSNVFDPASQRLLARVPDSTLLEVQNAVTIAQLAQLEWAALPFLTRREFLSALVGTLRRKEELVVKCLISEGGKTLGDAKAEFTRGLDAILTACSIGPEMHGSHQDHGPTQTYTVYEPLGVCISITPFNFPFLIPLWSVPYALITGNTVVLKPSEKTPSITMILADAFLEAEFPPGVFNIVHGGATVTDKLLSQPVVQAVSFVGSDIAAERVYEHARATRKRVQAECGGKNHGVVLEDADQKSSLYAIAGSAFGSAGQRCMGISVAVFVGETRNWIDGLVEISRALVVGYGGDSTVKVGPLINGAAKERVEGIVQRAIEEGASIVLDGRHIEVHGFPKGNFIGPTILTDVKPHMECYQTEIFGPVLVCLEVETLEEAIELVNENRYGNGCTLFTSKPSNGRIFEQKVNIGQVGVNVPILAPFSAVTRTANKDSFLGELNAPGRTYWPFFTRTKTINARW